MKSKLVAFFAVVMATLLPSGTAWAADASPFRQTANVANAHFVSVDESRCVVTVVKVVALDLVTQQRPGPDQPVGPPVKYSQATVEIQRDDFCEDRQLVRSSGISLLDEDSFTFSGQSARLKTTMAVGDFPQMQIDVDVTWSKTGTINEPDRDVHFDFGPDCKGVLRLSDAAFSADASGTVSDSTSNFTPEPAEIGTLASTDEGQVTIGTACQ